jgi:hypothetical protein
MDPAVATALAHLKASTYMMWDEVQGEDRSMLIDLMLDGLAHLDYYEDRPYLFAISEEGLRALQVWEMGDV